MSFNLFSQPTKDDIRVGYVDSTLGYIDDVTICEANQYAKDNPGTTFIFKDGDNNLRYLNINEVNTLTPNSLLSTTDECGGIQEYKECGPPRIQIFGGNGVGAVANPVVGKDGSLLAVDIVSGGHGYQYPPLVAAKDDCQFGNGAMLTAVLGETADRVEVYEGEDDFEDYQICADTDVGYGLKYDLDGQENGKWEPETYTNVSEDPIKREIELFQSLLDKPFWTTRKNRPDRIFSTSTEKTYEKTYDATHPTWDDFMNQYAVSPVKPSDSTGTDEAGKTISMEWEQNFPISGEYIFRGLCDETCSIYLDGFLIGNLKKAGQSPKPIQLSIREGNHIFRADLLNSSLEEEISATAISAKFIQQGTSFYFQVDGTGSSQIKLVMDVDDNPGIDGLAAKEVVIPSDSGNITLRRDISKEKDSDSATGTFTGGKKYGPIQINGAAQGSRGPFINSPSSLSIRDAGGDDENIRITFSITSSSGNTAQSLVSPSSWNTNPLGISLVIEAPAPPVPKEIPPVQTDECPPNPFWTTRFPNSSKKWYPVRQPTYKFQQGPNDTNSDILGAFAIQNALGQGLSVAEIQSAILEQGFSINENAKALLSSAQSTGSGSKWSDFMNRYAISPVLPDNSPGGDSSGTTFSNSWELDLPYDGFYGVKGTCDNNGRVLIDNIEVSRMQGFAVSNPSLTKIFLAKGRHLINVEVSNNVVDTNTKVRQKIFNTTDWRAGLSSPSPSTSPQLNPKFIQQGTSFYLQVDGSGSGQLNLSMDVSDNPNIAGIAAKEVIIPTDSGNISLTRDPLKESDSDNATGTFTGGKKYGPIQIIGAGSGARGPIIGSSTRLGIRDADGDDENIKVTVSTVSSTPIQTVETQSQTKNGVTYEGPEIFGHTDSRWSKFMNHRSVSPKVFNSIGEPDTRVIGKYTLTWKNVDFPETGGYRFSFQADNNASFKVGKTEIYRTSDFSGEKVWYDFNVTKGKYDISIELENVKTDEGGEEDFIFSSNPMGVALAITKDVIVAESGITPWSNNPLAISAVLIPPPCAKKIGGKGVVEKVIVNDPGNGYLPLKEQQPSYPVTLVLDDVLVEDPGINYRCGEDQIQIIPNNGAQLSYSCDSFGRIVSVNVLNPGSGFDLYPQITIVSETGVNATFRPVFRVIRDPLLPPDKIIQVTDLVGLKQTGYVNGRAYYGAVYYDEGFAYAGYYKTAGTQVRVYNTLSESISARVTTPASAIQRSGTDVTSNDPTLNIPGTIQSTTEET